jgi:hypothetical protein
MLRMESRPLNLNEIPTKMEKPLIMRKNYRQNTDKSFQDILNNVRQGTVTADDYHTLLNSRK